jgi:hypothetical protein
MCPLISLYNKVLRFKFRFLLKSVINRNNFMIELLVLAPFRKESAVLKRNNTVVLSFLKRERKTSSKNSIQIFFKFRLGNFSEISRIFAKFHEILTEFDEIIFEIF